MVPKVYQFRNLPSILPKLQKGPTTIEWTWRHPRKANNDIIFVWYAQ